MDAKWWNIYFYLKGPGGMVEAPNNANPVQCGNMGSLLDHLAGNLPGGQLGIELVGLRIEQVSPPETSQE